ncbi:MAG: acetylesterase [Oscillospiraceae bacterium]|nr:acetylesterase [Oscillospiraceae bacterium]
MSTLQVTFRSPSLVSPGEFWLHLPEKHMPDLPFLPHNPNYDRPARTLILLHGFSGNCQDFLLNSVASEISFMYNMAVVMPSGGLNFFLDLPATGQKYMSFIGEDLINYLRETFGLAATREDTYIGGASMGGFGAMHTAFAYPERFGGVVAISSALIIDELKDMKPGYMDKNVMANYDYYVHTFGDLQTAKERDVNPEVLYRKLKAEGKPLPRIYMACGTEDFLLQHNRDMRDFLRAENADMRYEEGPGVHTWSFWNPRTVEGLQWLLSK